MIKTCLVVAAHPDDEVLGCGGTIARFSSEGVSLFTLILGEGVTSRDSIRSQEQRKRELKDLHEAAREANHLLGAQDVFFENLPDNRFDSLDLLDITKIVERYVEKIQPEWVFTHNESDINNDHSIVLKAVETACRPLPGHPVKGLFSFPILSSTEWNFKNNFCPNFFIDIESFIHKKINAMKIYSSELKLWPHPRSIKTITINSQLYGSYTGKNNVEAFRIIRMML
mgnify:CR=1 FL=1